MLEKINNLTKEIKEEFGEDSIEVIQRKVVYKERLAQELHNFSMTLQVNYARCMTRKDYVTAAICIAKYMEDTLHCLFLLKAHFPLDFL